MTLEIEILGCGSSSGVPAIGNNWGACNPDNPKNKRLRSSILVKSKESTIIIDATPDLRQQLLNANVKSLDAVFITHTHSDHINGIDDFRFLNVIMNKDLNLYATKDVLKKIKERFGYVFEELVPEAKGFYYKPCLIPNEIKSDFLINDLKISCIEQNHGYMNSTGFRFNNFAYCSDVLEFKKREFKKLENLDLWIVDCLRFEPHKTHAHFEKVMNWIKLLKPKKTILTHMNYEVDYDYIMSKVPNNCVAAYDGLKIKV
mgnify:FL=1